ncbi:Mce protein [Mycobacterium camsae]|uniref:Mce protein n=1 Tax=Mycobacterium gordonae TaxID=1778 RepID=UPI00197D0EA3|nr:Mce protein [Mycobacterium gordonae]
MEGDAGAGRLNPINEDDSLGTEAKDEDSTESESAADPADTEAKDEDSESGDEPSDSVTEEEPAVIRGKSRVGRAWLAGISAVLLIVAGAIAGGGYYALRSHQDIAALQRNDAAALNVAKDCVAATQAPDISSMAASEQKIVDCGTDQYRTQALLYSSMLVQAYQAANVHLKVSDMRAAVERNNPDGSVDVLIALRISVSNDQQQNQETGYRLRVRMAPTEGTYKISKLDQVTK